MTLYLHRSSTKLRLAYEKTAKSCTYTANAQRRICDTGFPLTPTTMSNNAQDGTTRSVIDNTTPLRKNQLNDPTFVQSVEVAPPSLLYFLSVTRSHLYSTQATLSQTPPPTKRRMRTRA